MRSLRKILLALAGALVLSVASLGPVLAAVGALEVTVYEVNSQGEQESLLDGARVIVKSIDGAVERAAVTIDGQATFAGLPEGDYKVNVMMPGYGQIGLDVAVLPNRVNQLPVGMRPQKREELTVRAAKDVVELEKGGQTETTITEDFFDNLPVLGREYQSVLTLAPGVQDDDGDGNPNVHGARERDFRMTVDGVSNVDPLTGQFQSFVNADAIEEIQVVDSGADASYGGATGGFGKIITKSGSNEIRRHIQPLFAGLGLRW
ncbi:MAG: TonB-dependent receptor plug domain-containing protein [Acidobacteriota bacterium]|nr:TonB-dependent receptor plug domain-containing protein [Acidobacteriota bacterium]